MQLQRRLGAFGVGLLLFALVAFEVATPSRFLASASHAPPLGPVVGHTVAHTSPDVLCASPTSKAALDARATSWAVTRNARVDVQAFNDVVPGPLLCATPGSTFALRVTNHLAVPLPFHIHDLVTIDGRDVTVLAPGEARDLTYEIPLDATGVHPYHATDAAQLSKGLGGVLLVRGAAPPNVDHEEVLVLSEWVPDVGGGTWAATLDGHAFPDAPHFVFEPGERVLFHLVNLGASQHTLHVHGHRWFDAEDGRAIDNKFLVPHIAPTLTGETQSDFVLVAGAPGDWMYHCHVYDHINAGMTGVMTVLGGEPHAH